MILPAATHHWKTLRNLFNVVLLLLIAGCASRRPIADRRPPPPVRPGTTTPEAGEPAKHSGDAEVSSSSSVAGAIPNRRKPSAGGTSEGYTEEGDASWYGAPFHGRRASNGEIYDMYKLTAAHRTLPFDTLVRVTNLNNGRSTTVRITDRGPFVENRIIDLSFAAAREIDSVGAGIVPVRLEILSSGINLSSGFFTVQVGAFRERANAERLRDRLNVSYSPIFIQQYDSPEGLYYRVRVGRVSDEGVARQFGEQLRSREGFTPFVVRLDEGRPAGGNE